MPTAKNKPHLPVDTQSLSMRTVAPVKEFEFPSARLSGAELCAFCNYGFRSVCSEGVALPAFALGQRNT